MREVAREQAACTCWPAIAGCKIGASMPTHVLMRPQAHIHTHAHTHACTHTHARTCTHTHTHTRTSVLQEQPQGGPSVSDHSGGSEREQQGDGDEGPRPQRGRRSKSKDERRARMQKVCVPQSLRSSWERAQLRVRGGRQWSVVGRWAWGLHAGNGVWWAGVRGGCTQ